MLSEQWVDFLNDWPQFQLAAQSAIWVEWEVRSSGSW